MVNVLNLNNWANFGVQSIYDEIILSYTLIPISMDIFSDKQQTFDKDFEQ